MSIQNSFKRNEFVEKTIDIHMNLACARSLWGFIKLCLEEQAKQNKFVMSHESGVKVITAWEEIAKAIDSFDKGKTKNAYGEVTFDAEAKEV